MRILLTGANGFIGSRLLAGLQAAGHEVVAAVRDVRAMQQRYPHLAVIPVDLNLDTKAEVWLPRLKGIEGIINCAGALHSRAGQDLSAIHAAAPIALFEAAKAEGILRVIQISAISSAADTEYALTKLQADQHLAQMDLDWVILRPSLVMDKTAFGGTALLRALSVMPFALPVPGRGDQSFQPVAMEDLVRSVVTLLDRPDIRRCVIDPVGPRRVTTKELLQFCRGWLGMPYAPVVSVPMALVRMAARCGDWFGQGALTTTSIRQIEFGNVGDPAAFEKSIGFAPNDPFAWLAAHPSGTADLWQARLTLLRPVIRALLVLLWLASALLGLLALDAPMTQNILAALGLPVAVAAFFCLWDLGLAVLLLLRRWPAGLTYLQLATILGYTLVLSYAQPGLWLDPLGALLKNLPILGLVLVDAILARER